MTTAARAESKPAMPAVSERDFQQAVLDYARLMGWRCYFTFNSRHSPAGYPDVVFVRKGRMVVAELKSATGKLTRAQEDWLNDLREVPSIDVGVWRPSDWPQIEAVLA